MTISARVAVLVCLAFSLAAGGFAGVTLSQASSPPGSNQAATSALGTAFTYQGQVRSGTTPITGPVDLRLILYDAEIGGSQVGTTQTLSGVPVQDGIFSVSLDFGAVWQGSARWLEVAVRYPATTGNWDTLSPRQPIGAAPYALYSIQAGSAPWSGIAGKPDLQNRVAGTCAVGMAVRVVNADGTVVCGSAGAPARAASPMGNTVSTVAVDADIYASITIGADGLPVISYFDLGYRRQKVARCADPSCTSATTNVIDGGSYSGMYSSIAIGADGLPLLSYQDVNSKFLKVAHCTDVACANATAATVVSAGPGGQVGTYSSITIGSDGLPIISYVDLTGFHVKVAHCSDPLCTSSSTSLIDEGIPVGTFTPITIGADGLPIVSYYDFTNSRLKVAHCANVACTAATLSILDTVTIDSQNMSIAIGSDGFPIIGYPDTLNGLLKVAHCSNAACTASSVATVDGAINVGWFTSITVGADGLPITSYYDSSNSSLKVAHCSTPLCSGATVSVAGVAGNVSQFSAITIGADGLPIISHTKNGVADLKVAHCASETCTPYFRRR